MFEMLRNYCSDIKKWVRISFSKLILGLMASSSILYLCQAAHFYSFWHMEDIHFGAACKSQSSYSRVRYLKCFMI